MHGIFKAASLAVGLIVFSAADALAVEWKVSLWGERRAFTEHVEKLAEQVADKTGGQFTLALSYGGLSNSHDNLEGLSTGAFQMAQFCAGYHPEKNPTLSVLELPFLGISTLEEENAVSRAVYAHPAVRKDMARWNVKLLMTSPMPQYNLAGTGTPRDTVKQFEGLRVRATGGVAQAFKMVGAIPTSVTAPDAYDAMAAGVVDAVSFAEHAHLAYRTIDIAAWWTANLNPGTVNCPIAVNLDAYRALSDEQRVALNSSVDGAMAHYLANYRDLLKTWDAVLAKNTVQKVVLSESELSAFRSAAAEPVRDRWIAEMTAAGLPAQELYDLVQNTLEEVRRVEAEQIGTN